MSHLLARLMNEEDGDSALQGSGAQPGARHQHLTPHTVQVLQAEMHTKQKDNYHYGALLVVRE